MTKTDQEIIVSRKYESGVEIEGFAHYYCMTTKNAVEIWGGCCMVNNGMTKTDQEIIVSRKYESGVE